MGPIIVVSIFDKIKAPVIPPKTPGITREENSFLSMF